MATPSNHWKLGLFVVSGVALGLTCLVVLGARSLHKDAVSYETYFDESVQGLEVGSPVKFRGVTIGTVSKIDVAPDRRHVAVTSDLGVEDVKLMRLGHRDGKHIEPDVPDDLRVQLASAGITGVKFLQLDFFPVKTNPVQKLPFPVASNYIPATVSTMKNLEDAVVLAVDRFPEMTSAAMKLIDRFDQLLDDVHSKRLPERTLATLADVDSAFTTFRATLVRLDSGKISAQAQQTLQRLDSTIARIDQVVARVDGEKGVVASAQRASDAMGDVASNARGLSDDLGATLRDVQEAAESIQKLTDALERDSDMLLKGRSRGAR